MTAQSPSHTRWGCSIAIEWGDGITTITDWVGAISGSLGRASQSREPTMIVGTIPTPSEVPQ
jgi:hypothetical protein